MRPFVTAASWERSAGTSMDLCRLLIGCSNHRVLYVALDSQPPFDRARIALPDAVALKIAEDVVDGRAGWKRAAVDMATDNPCAGDGRSRSSPRAYPSRAADRRVSLPAPTAPDAPTAVRQIAGKGCSRLPIYLPVRRVHRQLLWRIPPVPGYDHWKLFGNTKLHPRLWSKVVQSGGSGIIPIGTERDIAKAGPSHILGTHPLRILSPK